MKASWWLPESATTGEPSVPFQRRQKRVSRTPSVPAATPTPTPGCATRDQAERIARLGLLTRYAADTATPMSITEIDLQPFRSEAAEAAATRAGCLADVVRAQTWQLAGDGARATKILAARFGRPPDLNDGPAR